jgi:aminoacyl tRNA synthase complex-interacting multifunctional protein 1
VPPKQKKGAAKGGNQQQKGGDKNNKNNNNNKGKNKAEQKKPAAKKKGGEPLLWRLKVVVGSITSCAAHPSDENLLVAQIDIGGGETRQVVSGVAALTTPEAFTGQRVILCTNLKAGDLRGVQSNGRVLVVTGADKKTKSIITPPVGAALGEVVSVVGVAQEPPATCTGKHWSKLMKKFTVAGNVCQYDGLALQTKGGEDIKSTIETGTYA